MACPEKRISGRITEKVGKLAHKYLVEGSLSQEALRTEPRERECVAVLLTTFNMIVKS